MKMSLVRSFRDAFLEIPFKHTFARRLTIVLTLIALAWCGIGSAAAQDPACYSRTTIDNPLCPTRADAYEQARAQRDYVVANGNGDWIPTPGFEYSCNAYYCMYIFKYYQAVAPPPHFAGSTQRRYDLNSECPSGAAWNEVTKTCIDYNPDKNLGPGGCETGCGNPINAAIGNKYQVEPDFSVTPLLSFTRFYNSNPVVAKSHLGMQWRHSFDRSIEYVNGQEVAALRPEGKRFRYVLSGGIWQPDPDVTATLQRQVGTGGELVGWRYTERDQREVEEYDARGRLVRIARNDGTWVDLSYNNGLNQGDSRDFNLTQVQAQDGRTIKFSYSSDGRVDTVTDATGGQYQYGYDSAGRLVTLTYPDANQRQYHYNEASHTAGTDIPNVLTGISDENGNRYATYEYAIDARAISTQHAGMEKYDAVYGSSGAVIHTPTGGTETRTFTTVFGVKKIASVVKECNGCSPISTVYTYDAYGRIDKITNQDGVQTDHDFNTHGLETQRIDAANDVTGNKRTTQTEWNSDFGVPTERRTYNATSTLVAKTNWTYNSRGQTLTVTQTDLVTGNTRTSSTTYCEQTDVSAGTCPLIGLVKSVNGTRTDVADITSFAYYASDDAACTSGPTTCPHRKGDRWRVTNALGQVTETVAYDGAGRPISVKDANGIVTEMTYHPRGWITSRTVKGAAPADDRSTLIDYWPTGLVKRVTQEDGSYVGYAYDAAHRLTDIADSAGNAIHYMLDNAGNRSAEQTRDPNGALTRSLSRIHDTLNRLQSQADAYGHATGFTYDANGNTDVVTDALGRVTDNTYDPLNRLVQTIQDVGGIAATTQFQYDTQDNLTRVTDPKGLHTDYAYNRLGDLTQLTSPDTGATTYAYDSAGNRASQTDARAKTQVYSYDVLNRLTKITNPTRTYTYDNSNTSVCSSNERYPKGRLTGFIDQTGNTKYCYSRFGELVRKVQTTNAVVFVTRYAYDAAGRQATMTYPDGAVMDMVRDSEGQISELGFTPNGGVRQVVLTGATYAPFGPSTGWTYGNGRTLTRSLNQNYQPQAIQEGAVGGLSLGYGFDATGNMTLLQDAAATTALAQYGYDNLNRLTRVMDGPTGAPIETYGYDATGNRTSVLRAGVTTGYLYATSSHRLDKVGTVARIYDAAGSTTKIGGNARLFVYDASGRMTQTKAGSTVLQNYRYNAKGEQLRSHKVTTDNTYYVYDEAGHLLGQYNNAGLPIQQMIWFGDLPVGVLQGSGTSQKLHYIEPDHLGTPRVVIDGQRNVPIWEWKLTGEAFGDTPPKQDPDADGNVFVFDLRFPGQRYDSATGLNYNYLRDGYDPLSGRYTQPDPLGQEGGLATYAYVNSKPLMLFDPMGLKQGFTRNPNTGHKSTPRAPRSGPPPGGWGGDQGGVSAEDGADSFIPRPGPPKWILCTEMQCCSRRSGVCKSSDYCFKSSFTKPYPSPPEVESGIYDTYEYTCKCSVGRLKQDPTGPDEAGPEDLLELLLLRLRMRK